MARTASVPYASPTAACWQIEGLKVSDTHDTFKAKNPAGEVVELTAVSRTVDFENNLAMASAFFGSTEKLVQAAEDSVNDYMSNRAKSVARALAFGLEKKIQAEIDDAIAKFTAKRGVPPTPAQVEILTARVRAANDFDNV